MNYTGPELLSRLGAEYVLGTLRGAARRRFERLLAASVEARRHVEFWQHHLLPPPGAATLAPPAASRQRLLAAVGLPPPRRHALPGAQIFFSGLAAGIVLAAVLGMHLARKQEFAAPALLDATADAGVPIYLSRLGIPLSSMQWLLSESADRRQLIVVAGGDFPQLGRHRIELWCLDPAAAAPILLGSLPVEQGTTVRFELPSRLHGESDVRFGISLEPDHPQRSTPQGPMLDIKGALDQI